MVQDDYGPDDTHIVAESNDRRELSKAVSKLQAEGWQCQGGVAVSVVHLSFGCHSRYYVQALVRELGSRGRGK